MSTSVHGSNGLSASSKDLDLLQQSQTSEEEIAEMEAMLDAFMPNFPKNKAEVKKTSNSTRPSLAVNTASGTVLNNEEPKELPLAPTSTIFLHQRDLNETPTAVVARVSEAATVATAIAPSAVSTDPAKQVQPVSNIETRPTEIAQSVLVAPVAPVNAEVIPTDIDKKSAKLEREIMAGLNAEIISKRKEDLKKLFERKFVSKNSIAPQPMEEARLSLWDDFANGVKNIFAKAEEVFIPGEVLANRYLIEKHIIFAEEQTAKEKQTLSNSVNSLSNRYVATLEYISKEFTPNVADTDLAETGQFLSDIKNEKSNVYKRISEINQRLISNKVNSYNTRLAEINANAARQISELKEKARVIKSPTLRKIGSAVGKMLGPIGKAWNDLFVPTRAIQFTSKEIEVTGNKKIVFNADQSARLVDNAPIAVPVEKKKEKKSLLGFGLAAAGMLAVAGASLFGYKTLQKFDWNSLSSGSDSSATPAASNAPSASASVTQSAPALASATVEAPVPAPTTAETTEPVKTAPVENKGKGTASTTPTKPKTSTVQQKRPMPQLPDVDPFKQANTAAKNTTEKPKKNETTSKTDVKKTPEGLSDKQKSDAVEYALRKIKLYETIIEEVSKPVAKVGDESVQYRPFAKLKKLEETLEEIKQVAKNLKTGKDIAKLYSLTEISDNLTSNLQRDRNAFDSAPEMFEADLVLAKVQDNVQSIEKSMAGKSDTFVINIPEQARKAHNNPKETESVNLTKLKNDFAKLHAEAHGEKIPTKAQAQQFLAIVKNYKAYTDFVAFYAKELPKQIQPIQAAK